MYIDGHWLNLDSTFAVTNPANGQVLGEVANGNREHAKLAIDAADKAFASWSKTTAYQRSAILLKAHQLMLERKSALAELMTSEQGKPLKASMNEVQYAADFLLWFGEEAKRVYGETIPSARADQRFIVRYQPVGVVAAITPWNYPISMLTRKLGPALAAGCTVVLKPAEATPLCAKAVFEILEEAGLPAGVANLVTAEQPDPIGAEFCSNEKVKKITFTGSTAVGKKIAQDAAAQVKQVSMELGGHAPFIVFDDADPVHAAKGASLVKFLNTGQACISPNRIFVQRKILPEFVETLTQRVAKMQVGDGMNPAHAIGPLVNAAAVEKVDNQVQDAVAKGAKLHHGGAAANTGSLADGHFYTPTVLSEINEEMLIYREETFGPVAAVLPFDTYEEVIQRANDTRYGLAAYVYTNHLATAMRAFEE
ncbi:MAG: NAD-dependent succinate-semialdehyde dehydrogenase, partial [Pseudomonadota bacterium]